MANVNWKKVKNEYVNDPKMSYRKLAEKYHVSQQTVSKYGKAENWVALRKEKQNEIWAQVEQETTKKIVEAEVDRIANIIKLCDSLYERVEKAIGQLDIEKVDGESVKTGVINTYKLRQLVQSTKDLRDIIKGDADTTEIEDVSEVERDVFG